MLRTNKPRKLGTFVGHFGQCPRLLSKNVPLLNELFELNKMSYHLFDDGQGRGFIKVIYHPSRGSPPWPDCYIELRGKPGQYTLADPEDPYRLLALIE